MVYLCRPDISALILLNVMGEFWQFLGLRVSATKLVLFLLGQVIGKPLQSLPNSGLPWTTDEVKCLAEARARREGRLSAKGGQHEVRAAVLSAWLSVPPTLFSFPDGPGFKPSAGLRSSEIAARAARVLTVCQKIPSFIAPVLDVADCWHLSPWPVARSRKAALFYTCAPKRALNTKPA
ncbi:hypothetical protein NDU88_009844 [Pleurodeles waltl]|uniref:Uncharacterized protein n=1 Tax=Pleurodeles waltl TaxID=8319 RepID=A0AAV7QSQ8_PLEWA|nr:hypothetical protein NDU88_009844 [Pleurodeles waltl]